MERRALLGLAALALSAGPAAAAGGAKSAASTSSYARYPTVTSTIVRPGGRRGTMTVELGLDVRDEALRLRAQQMAPRLRAAFNTVVQRSAATLLPGAPPDLERLARDLQAATNAVMGRAGAKVLLGTVLVI